MNSLKYLAFGLAVFTALLSLAQSQNPSDVSTTQPRVMSMTQEQLLSRVHATNQMEIKLGQMAKEKGSSDKVKKYGDRIVRDHRFADQKIIELAKKENITLHEPIPMSADEKIKMDKHHELVNHLESAQGADFDKSFLDGMQSGHEEAIQMLKSAKLSDKKTQKLIGKLTPILEQHFSLASHLDHKMASNK